MNNRIYLDNAATTKVDAKVVEAMMPFLMENFGNPSSIYSYGREVKAAIEKARKTVATLLGANPGEIFFTSGGTESSNMIMRRCVNDLGVKHIITSPLEHHCVLHTAEDIEALGRTKKHLVDVNEYGDIDLIHLENMLKELKGEGVLVSLMHGNNEIGNLLDLTAVGTLVKNHGAYFHSDTVQTTGHFKFNLKEMPIDFITGSAHKFHGPKGAGIVYISENVKVKPYVAGGGQERNMRAGTENVTGIVGFAKALELAYENFEAEKQHMLDLKFYLKKQLENNFEGLLFNGRSGFENSMYTVLSVGFPKNAQTEMLLYTLDMDGICVSGGSACSSGANAGSHVIQSIYKGKANQSTIRFSFSKFNTKAEIDKVVEVLIQKIGKAVTA
jgi:cysteine desulfurase